jgi:hypothetical protein
MVTKIDETTSATVKDINALNAVQEAKKAELNAPMDLTNPAFTFTLAVVALDTKASDVKLDVTSQTQKAKTDVQQVQQSLTLVNEKKKGTPDFGYDPIMFAWSCCSEAVNVQNQTALLESQLLQRNADHQSEYMDLSADVKMATPTNADLNPTDTNDANQKSLEVNNSLTTLNMQNEANQQIVSFFTDTIMVDRQTAQVHMSNLDADTQSSQQGQSTSSSLMQLMLTLTQKINYTKK